MDPLSRDFTAPWQSRTIQDLIQTLLIAETTCPSAQLWVLSGWITDLPMLDNSARSFSGVAPDWPAGPVEFSRVLQTIARRGGRVAVVLRDVDHNANFIRRVRGLQAEAEGRLGLAVSHNAHEKALVGDEYVLGGSMNFTHNGMNASDEHLLLKVDREAAASRRLALDARWTGELQWG